MRRMRHFRALLGTRARFWLNLQARYDLAVAERDHAARIAAEADRAAQSRMARPKMLDRQDNR